MPNKKLTFYHALYEAPLSLFRYKAMITTGISKLGALIGVFVSLLFTYNFRLAGTPPFFAGFFFAGVLLTPILLETAGKSLEISCV